MAPRDDDSSLSPAGELFAEYLAQLEDAADSSDDPPDLERFCDANPKYADELRALYARWAKFVAPIGSDAAATPSESHAHAQSLLVELRELDVAERYEDQGAVGRGGMGEVRAVYDRTLRRTLAMKVLLDGRNLGASRGLVRFLDEARISAQLDHPGIVPVHELGLDAEGRVYFTMPLIRGRNLSEVYSLAQDGDPEWTRTRVLSSLLRVCEAVAFAHSRGVLHRDLKPANIMVGPFGETYVVDWGLAKVVDVEGEPQQTALASDRSPAAIGSNDSTLLTGAGTVVGTPSYLAPEQAAGRAVDERVDIYSIGAMLYELLGGCRPYTSGTSNTPDALLAALASGPPAPLRSLAVDVPPELEAICERAMAWDINQRYSSAAALGEDLRAFLEGRVVAAYKTGAVAELRKWVARNRATAIAASAALLIAIAGSVGLGLLEASRRTQVEAKNRELESSRQEEARLADIARTRAEEVLRLSDIGRLDRLEERADSLWPLHPTRSQEFERWIIDAEALSRRGEELHRPTLQVLREGALTYTAEARAVDESRQAGFAERAWFEEVLADRTAELERLYRQADAQSPSPKLRSQIGQWEESVETLQSKLYALQELPFRRLTWTFDTAEEQWEHDTLSALVERLEGLSATDGLLTDVRRRLDETERLARDSLTSETARAAWSSAVAAIADTSDAPAYAGMHIAPQFGLLPIGVDRESGLWEFAHLPSGSAPARNPDTGELILTIESSVVLVLLPGGGGRFGAQPARASLPHYDPNAAPNESPAHGMVLAPYFLSKYELTQGQWLRARGSNPSDLSPGRYLPDTGVGLDTTLLHPVETVSWSESVETLRQLGLALPTEAQWEHAARAGTATPWYTGGDFESLNGHVNAADRTLFESGQVAAGGSWMEWLDDGRALHGPVGSYAPNPLGLHDVFGNVAEWCADDYSPYSNPPREGDGLRTMLLAADRIARGGSFLDGIQALRASARNNYHGDPTHGTIGVRPARALDTNP